MVANQITRNKLRSQQGSATLEAVALFFVFVVMMAYTIGSFGVVHTGILNSIAARNYAFETFRNRTNLQYFRDIPTADAESYLFSGLRVHGITDEKGGLLWMATTRQMAMGFSSVDQQLSNNPSVHGQLRNPATSAFEQRSVNPVWVKTVYGICLNSACEGVQ